MSLADELEAEVTQRGRISQIDQWLNEWRPTLNKADRDAIDAALADPQKSPTQIFRVLKRHGCPGGDSGFVKWLRNRRESG